MNCKNCGYGLKQRCGDFEKIICTYEEGECVKITELEKQSKLKRQQLTKAREIILKLYNAGRDVLMCRAEEKAYNNLEEAINDKSIEQFLKEEEND